MPKLALITGASKGLGKALAQEFKLRGYEVIGVSRSKPDIEIEHLSADITSAKGIQKIVNRIKRAGGLDVLINNAGAGIYDSWQEMKILELRELMEINFFAQVNLTQVLLPFLKKNQGTVINMSSVAGVIYVPYMGGYSASKFALTAFSDSLRAELSPFAVKVLTVFPGRINTGFADRAYGSRRPPHTPFASSPEVFARKVFQSFKRNRKNLVYPWWYKIIINIGRILPSVYDQASIAKWR